MRVDILTIFPKMFDPVLNESIVKRARLKGKVKFYIHDLRDFTSDKHRKVDDRPFGGGSGMVMRVEPIFNCIQSIKRKAKDAKVILFTPQGRRLDQGKVKKLSKLKHLILICGHYEGVDERVRSKIADEEISIGDYVLTGGEIPAMILIDSVARMLPDVVKDKASVEHDSFYDGMLDYPHYTRPAKFKNMKVPDVLLSGNFAKIEKWREDMAYEHTKKRRPDLLEE